MHAACINWVFSSGYSVFCQFNSQSLETEPIRVEGEGFPLQIKIVKDPFKVQVKTVNFNVTVQNKKKKKQKNSTKSLMCFQIPQCNETVRNYQLSSCGALSKKNSHNYLKRLLGLS